MLWRVWLREIDPIGVQVLNKEDSCSTRANLGVRTGRRIPDAGLDKWKQWVPKGRELQARFWVGQEPSLRQSLRQACEQVYADGQRTEP